MKYFPRVRRPSHHQVWGIFADINTISKHVDVPTVEIVTSFIANPDKAVKLNAAAYSRTVAVNAGHRQRSMWQRDIPLLSDHASDGSPLAVTAYGLTEHELINRAPEAYKPDLHFGIYDEDAELAREIHALTKRYEREGVNLTVMIENASTHPAAASNLWEFITRHPEHRGLITRYLGAVNAPTERDTL